VCGLDLCAVCSYMAGNTGRGICGSWIGILGEGSNFGTRVNLRKKIATVGASGMCS
jgi:hypothetical protein